MKNNGFRYTKEEINYLKRLIKNNNNTSKIIDMYFKKFNKDITHQQVYSFKKYYCKKNRLLRRFNTKETNYIVDLLNKYRTRGGNKIIIDLFYKKYKKKISNAHITYLRKKYELEVKNYRLSERIEGRGFNLIKINNKWYRKQRVILNIYDYDKCVIFKDGNKNNLDKSNLVAINKKDLMYLNGSQLYDAPYMIKKVALQVKKLNDKVKDKIKEKKIKM